MYDSLIDHVLILFKPSAYITDRNYPSLKVIQKTKTIQTNPIQKTKTSIIFKSFTLK